MQSNLLTTADPPAAQEGVELAQTGLTAVVVAANEVLRRGLAGLLLSLPEIKKVHEGVDPRALETVLRRLQPDLMVVAAADGGWLEGRYEAIAEAGTTILVVVDQASIEDLAQYPSPPVGGFLWQPSLTAAHLRDALRRRNGEVRMPPDLLRALLTRAEGSATGSGRSRPVNLTGREREALALLVKGLSNKQIARRLGISSHGAKRLVASIMLKLDAPNRTLAAVIAIRAGLIDPQ